MYFKNKSFLLALLVGGQITLIGCGGEKNKSHNKPRNPSPKLTSNSELPKLEDLDIFEKYFENASVDRDGFLQTIRTQGEANFKDSLQDLSYKIYKGLKVENFKVENRGASDIYAYLKDRIAHDFHYAVGQDCGELLNLVAAVALPTIEFPTAIDEEVDVAELKIKCTEDEAKDNQDFAFHCQRSSRSSTERGQALSTIFAGLEEKSGGYRLQKQDNVKMKEGTYLQHNNKEYAFEREAPTVAFGESWASLSDATINGKRDVFAAKKFHFVVSSLKERASLLYKRTYDLYAVASGVVPDYKANESITLTLEQESSLASEVFNLKIDLDNSSLLYELQRTPKECKFVTVDETFEVR